MIATRVIFGMCILPFALEVRRVISIEIQFILWKELVEVLIGMYRVLFCVAKVNFVICEGIILCNSY